MQTLRNQEGLFLNTWPKPEEWATKPEISFSLDNEKTIAKGDRILVCTTMVKSGPLSGSIKDIYYYIDEVLDNVELTEENQRFITATATRKEL